MHRIVLLLCLIATVPAAHAAGSATNGPNADSTSLGQKPAATEPSICPDRPPPAQGAPSGIVVELDADTLWRPRGAEVRFTIRSPGARVDVKKVTVCFGWSSPDATYDNTNVLVGSPQVRSVSNDTGVTEYGAIVPRLQRVPSDAWWPRRLLYPGRYVFTGAYTVPVADMVISVTNGDNIQVLTSTQVGVTEVWVAWLVVAVVVGLIWAIMDRIARYRDIPGTTLLLRVISTRDGYASLSQLQIVLWTLVVGLSAIYVMTLSGNLISISAGTLILLGIASGSALVARVPPGAAATRPADSDPPPPPLPPPLPPLGPIVTETITPQWADLVIADRRVGEIDVTRLQMLAFTLITAAFVLIKVLVDYEIPEIPANFLVLMGISNGVYVTGRRLPSKPREAGGE